MRAKEFIQEAKDRKPLRKSAREATPNMTSYDKLDNNNHPYLAYRFGIALAGSPDNEDNMYKEGPNGGNFTIIDFSEGDAEIRRGAERKMGVPPGESTGPGSKELDRVVNKVSPVAKPKPNQFGV